MDDNIFHAGERLVQERTGERGTALINSRSISTGIQRPHATLSASSAGA